MKNMKIEVNGNLDEIVVELERLGYKKLAFAPNRNTKFIVTNEFNKFTDIGGFDHGFYTNNKLTTLSELKEMK